MKLTAPAWVVSLVRSLIQAAVGHLMAFGFVTAALDWLTVNANLVITQSHIETAGFIVGFGLVVSITNWLGRNEHFLWINKIISLWLSQSAAAYANTTKTPDINPSLDTPAV